jgi:hypothetical protein
VNALANPEVGRFIGTHFVASFQKVATFRIVNGQKQGGNVASYFCAPDGRVLHVVAGPVDAATMLREAKWVVESAKRAIEESRKTGTPFKTLFRRWHADRLRAEFGLVVEPSVTDAPQASDDDPLQFRDPTGRPLVPVLPPPPIQGPDVSFKDAVAAGARLEAAKAAPAECGRRCREIGTGWRVHQILAAHALIRIEKVYGTVFENILGEKISTQPVVTINTRPTRGDICLNCATKGARE